MTHLVRRLGYRIGHRGAALLFFAFLDLVFGYSLLAPTPELLRNPTYAFLQLVAPLWAWATLWLLAGGACLVSAFLDRDWLGFTLAMLIKILWGGIYLAMAVLGVGPRAYVSATLWLCLAGFVYIISTWPNPDYRRSP